MPDTTVGVGVLKVVVPAVAAVVVVQVTRIVNWMWRVSVPLFVIVPVYATAVVTVLLTPASILKLAI